MTRNPHETTIATGPDGYTTVTYRDTEVVRFNEHVVILDTGGHRTLATKARMNRVSAKFGLGFRVIKVDFAWFVQFPDTNPARFGDQTFTFGRK